MEKIVIVNQKDEILGLEERTKCHLGEGILHRAITVFIFNKKKELLITKRSKNKKLWPNTWETSCSTHLYSNETYKEAGERRVPEELGFTCKLKYLLKFQYKAEYQSIGSEYEICALLTGTYNRQIKPNKKEILGYKWITIKDLKKDFMNKPNQYAPWLKIALKKFLNEKNNLA